MEKMIRQISSEPVGLFNYAREKILSSEFKREYVWQQNLDVRNVTEREFLEEAAWVVINSGFKERTARKYFGNISLAFGDWESAQHITAHREMCINCALSAFRNERKIVAIADIAEIVFDYGFDRIHKDLSIDPISSLSKFPFIGPITVWHLAKNLGCDVAKPDRHIVRLAETYGYDCVQMFCRDIAKETGEKMNVVDIVLWRYLATFH